MSKTNTSTTDPMRSAKNKTSANSNVTRKNTSSQLISDDDEMGTKYTRSNMSASYEDELYEDELYEDELYEMEDDEQETADNWIDRTFGEDDGNLPDMCYPDFYEDDYGRW